ncbi:type VI secretion system baseplate subunit TssF [Vibrio sp. WXL210]|uniref:type VI secretion system baseplate subunit TssF n=1 Tax=Vibrio sp. WXL210 TaxID=3450709 RepID=UPI003EC8E453
METNKYFQDELSYLRESGEEFARHHPQLSQFLSRGSLDPDVERLLEGFAFLTGRLRQKLDAELPEITQSLMSLLWPHYLRSVPSMCVTELMPHDGALSNGNLVNKGCEVQSIQVEDTRCQFQTCYDVELHPIKVERILQHDSRSSSRVDIHLVCDKGATLSNAAIDSLRLFLNGEPFISRQVYLWLNEYLEKIEVTAGERTIELSTDKLKPVGFSSEQGMLPYSANCFSGYRYLQEYFALPEKFMFFDLEGLGWTREMLGQTRMTLSFVFEKALPSEVKLKDHHIKLHCSPAVNLFDMDADPIRHDKKRTQYRVRPQTTQQEHYEVYSVDQVQAWNSKSRSKVDYTPFESFEHHVNVPTKTSYYKERVEPNLSANKLDKYISFFSHSSTAEQLEPDNVLLKLTCTNANLPHRLNINELNVSSHNSTTLADITNITKPTKSVAPQVDNDLHWQLIANMSLNYTSLMKVENLRVLLSAYDFHARIDQQSYRVSRRRLEGIVDVSMKSVERIHRGLPVRGKLINLKLDSSKFLNQGEMYLFASVLNRFFSLYASINSSTCLQVEDIAKGETFTWQWRQGCQDTM